MTHTPGPWHDDGYRIYAPTDAADKRNARIIVEYKHVDAFNNADAPLIAAAPDLLVAAKAALNDRMYREWPDVADLLIAAIAKAEGQ